MKRILALAFATAMTIAFVPTDADAQRRGKGGGGMGGGAFAGGMGGGGHWHGGYRRHGYGLGAAAAGAAALGAGAYWGSGYDPYGAYASDYDSCQQQRTVWRNGAYRTVWVNVC